jgi:tetratricopeptide (TPR) repeat protein
MTFQTQPIRTSTITSIICLTAILVAIASDTAVRAANGPGEVPPMSSSAKRKYGFLRPQNDMVNHSLFMGLDIPPNQRVPQNKIPRTQNDFLLMREKNNGLLQKDPKNLSALLEFGYASRNLNDLQSDIASCTKAIELDPASAAAYAERGMAYEGSPDFEKALADFQKAVSLDPKNPVFYAYLGRLSLRSGKFRGAIEQCTKSIAVSSQNSAVFYYRGKAYLSLSEFQNAIKDFDTAIKIDPDDEVGYYIDRACAKTHLNSLNEAIEDLKLAIKVDSDDFPRQIDVAFTEGQSENTPEARQKIFDLARELIDIKPYSQLLQRALFNRFLSEYPSAISEFDATIKRYPLQPELYLYRGETYADMKEEEKARANFSRVLELQPANADAYGYRARSFINQKDYVKAIADLDQLIKIRPDRFAFMMRSGAYAASGNMEKAAADRQNFLAYAKTAYQAKNTPNIEQSNKFLTRDLDDYFSKKFGKKVHVDFETIPAKTTILAMFGLPGSYYWLKILHDGKLLDQGAAFLWAVQKERFVVHKYASIIEIKKNPKTIDKSCPPEVRESFLKHAGLNSASAIPTRIYRM